jgi:hypothetical protein
MVRLLRLNLNPSKTLALEEMCSKIMIYSDTTLLSSEAERMLSKFFLLLLT